MQTIIYKVVCELYIYRFWIVYSCRIRMLNYVNGDSPAIFYSDQFLFNDYQIYYLIELL